MNLPVALPQDLEDAVLPAQGELVRYLRAHGARVAVIFEADAWELWRRSLAALGEQGEEALRQERAAAVFARALAEEQGFDWLIFPSLVYREARLEGRLAQWDGVRRRIRYRTRSSEPAGGEPPEPPPSSWTSLPQMRLEQTGRITGLSLHVLVVAPEGELVYQGLGGLDLVHDAVKSRDGSGEPAYLRLQPRLLADARHVEEGVARALDPLVLAGGAR